MRDAAIMVEVKEAKRTLGGRLSARIVDKKKYQQHQR